MALLPVVERELRTAARRRRTYGLRWLAATGAAGICTWECWVLAGGQQTTTLGRSLFSLLAALGFAYALLIGPFLTADAISEERREGTLGLLFLTRLRSWHVVVGKWLASSLVGFFSLTAILPAMGLPLLLGGVTPGEYGRVALGTLNAMFFSLAGGLWVSCLSRDAGRAVLGSVALVLGLAGVLPGLVVFLGNAFGKIPVPMLTPVAWISPAWVGYQAMDSAYRAAPTQYWNALAVSHGISWLFLLGTGWLMPRLWREPVKERRPPPRWLLRLGYTRGWRRTFRRRLERNPIWAVAARLRWPHWVFWTLVLLVALNVYWLTFGYRVSPGSAKFHQNFAYGLVFTNRVWVCVMACHLILEARRSGALELVLTTPIPPCTFLRGHWRALRNYFFWPIVVIALLHVFYVWGTWSSLGQRGSFSATYLAAFATGALSSFVSFLSDVIALSVVGTWLSLSMRRPGWAVLTTLLLVILGPFLLAEALGRVRGLAPSAVVQWLTSFPWFKTYVGSSFALMPLVRMTAWVAKNLLLAAWAWRRLRTRFRDAAAGTLHTRKRRYRWRRFPAPRPVVPSPPER